MLRKVFVGFMVFVLSGGITMAAKTIDLPKPKITGKISLEEAILKRRSERSFLPKELSLEQISQLLWAAQGITNKSRGFRACPSAGALYPLTLYILKKDGIFRYIPDGHKLIQTSTGDRRLPLAIAALGQTFIGKAPLVIVIAGNLGITESKYGQRANRYVSIEVGHAAQNIHLQAVALGLVSVPIGAFVDSMVAKVLELPDKQDPYYIIPVGYSK